MSLNSKLEKLQEDLKLTLGLLGTASETETEEQRATLHARLSDISTQIIDISKKGDVSVFLINLTQKRWLINRSYASFWIRGKTDDEDYGVTEIKGHGGKVDTGRGAEPTPDRGWRVKLDPLYWPAELIAKDICREINGDLPALQVKGPSHLQRGKIVKTMGVFISLTAEPSEELLQAERDKVRLYFAALVAEGNMMWQKTHDYRLISDLNREAVDYLGVSTEWHQSIDAIMQDTSRRTPGTIRRQIANR